MKYRMIASGFLLYVSAVAVIGCGSSNSDLPVEDTGTAVAPQSLEQAKSSIHDVLTALKRDSSNSVAKNAEAQLLQRLDTLNHLVARVEISPNHQVKFYEPLPGQILVAEHRSKEQTPLLSDADHDVLPVTLFKKLAPTDAVPIELVNAQDRVQKAPSERVAERTQETGSGGTPISTGTGAPVVSDTSAAATSGSGSENVASQTSPLTAADGAAWRANECFKGWPSLLCLPNWGNGGFWDSSARQSGLKIAPFSGDRVVVTALYEGGIFFVDTSVVGDVDEWWMGSPENDCAGFWPFRVCQKALKHHRWEISDAAGDQFHWSAYAYNH